MRYVVCFNRVSIACYIELLNTVYIENVYQYAYLRGAVAKW
jgi:hypothetical protein